MTDIEMNDSSTTENAPEFTGRSAAIRLGGGLLVALLLVLVFTWRDNGRRAELETTAEFTAVGDSNYFPMPVPPPSAPYLAVAKFQGQPLYPLDYRRHSYEPDDMARVGTDEKGGYFLYQAPERAKDADERKLWRTYFLKISAKEYLKTRTAQKAE